eukprot:scaffold306439_cov32-Tisochrysis_lutea.AAC.2
MQHFAVVSGVNEKTISGSTPAMRKAAVRNGACRAMARPRATPVLHRHTVHDHEIAQRVPSQQPGLRLIGREPHKRGAEDDKWGPGQQPGRTPAPLLHRGEDAEAVKVASIRPARDERPVERVPPAHHDADNANGPRRRSKVHNVHRVA